ncbi:MAG: outer membrane beta-barrel protein [Chitinophagaceae bacterium]|nr:outer membrane beta-barrel protein [Chitinophagaceae bacterium]
MKKLLAGLIIILAAMNTQGQRLFFNVFGGISNYQGDLQEKRYTFDQAHPAFGIGLSYEITDKLFARANITMGKLSGNDAKGSKNLTRNLNFSSPITDVHAGLAYNFMNLYERNVTPYVFAGISYFSFSPYTQDSIGQKVNLQPLSTEGQGFVSGRPVYKLSQFSIPFGGGVKFALSDNFRVGLEVGVRKTNTDYIDDVSTTFVDQNLLLANQGQLAVDLAFRGDELKTGLTYPAEGTLRGSSKNKDWYYFSGVTVAYRLGAGGGKKGIGCPRAVY